MKLPNPTLVVALSLIGLSGCGTPLKTDADIGADIRRKIDSLNRIVIAALRDQKADVIFRLGSEEFKKTDSVRIKLRWMMRDLKGLGLKDYEVMHQVYSDKLRADSATFVKFNQDTDQEYVFAFAQPGRPSVATFASIPEDFRDFGFFTCFSRTGDTWKLMSLRIGLYRLQGLNAVDWYFKSSQQTDADDIIDANLQQTLADYTLLPAGYNIRYTLEKQIINQRSYIDNRAKSSFSFPIFLDASDVSAPTVIDAGVNCEGVTCLPMFTVKTTTALTDTAGLHRDSQLLIKNLDRLFKGISNRNKEIVVRLVNREDYGESGTGDYAQLRVETVADWRY